MTEVISVRFRSGCKNYDFAPNGLTLHMGDQVIVETAQGLEFATCTSGNHEIPDESVVQPLSPVVRLATDNDRRTVEYNRKRESEAFDICEKKIADHNLEMKLVSVSASFDGNKIIFYFTADGRVDFRELVRDLASVFRARIELRQIGVRDEAKMTGGLGICGRPFCCSQFLTSFMPVSIKMAKTQNLSLNPAKISGTCGRLMCCLKYEQNAYEDAAKRMPKQDSFVQTPDGPGNVKSVDLLRETVRVSLDDAAPNEQPKCYHNCEVCVLRNGKGSRDGIEIPQRTERYVEENKLEELPMPSFRTDVVAEDYFIVPEDTDTPVETEEKPASRRRHRGGRRGGRGSGERKSAEAQQPKQEKSEKQEKPARDKAQQERRVSRPGRRDKPGREGGAAPKAEAPKTENQQPRAPRTEGGEKRRRFHHRGHRGGRGNGGGNGGNAGGEA